MVTRIDAHFGNILAALEDPDGDGDTSDSIAANTLVVFQSDNGGPRGMSHVELNTNGGLSGTKGKIQEGGIRVPLVMRWPAKITAESQLKAGENCDMVVDVTDLLPTFCELAGAPIPLGIDGVSIAPTLIGNGHQRRREFIIHEAGNGQSIIRGNYKLVRSKGSALRLYDLDADRTESDDIAAQHPEMVRELESLLLGERVAEPKGFANTYHSWTGQDGGNTSDPDNWSDYQYANAGITYMTDDAAPQLSWIARIENHGNASSTTFADSDLSLLALAVGGNPAKNARQFLTLAPDVNLMGRNEIRLTSHATLQVNGGTISSLRWIEIHPGGTLSGRGAINGDVFNHGIVEVTGGNHATLSVSGDYHHADSAELKLTIADNEPALRVAGETKLAGVLTVTLARGFKPVAGASYTVLTADRVTGAFDNPHGEVAGSDGSRFTISYSKSSVTLRVK
jgi:hypothetical protein